ncbi:MAG: AIM24 family protein [Microscillaceae bacterium]|nr:AIM24 family protein [Microscillaceae bacterium]MDW8460222.1 AIM24 family protein [Cytophagales bacterium]
MLFGNIKHETSGKNDNILEISLLPNSIVIANPSYILWHQTEIHVEIRPNDGYEPPDFSEAEKNATELESEITSDLEEIESNFLEPSPEQPTDFEQETENHYLSEMPSTSKEENEKTSQDVENKSLMEKLWGAIKKSFAKATTFNKQQNHQEPAETPEEETSQDYDLEAPQSPPPNDSIIDEDSTPNEDNNETTEQPSEKQPSYPFLWAHCINTSQENEALIKLTNPQGGEVIALDLVSFDNQEIIVQAQNFLCAMQGVQISPFLQYEALVSEQTQAPFTLLKLKGEKLVFLQSADEILEEELDNDAIRVNLAHILAFDNGIEIDMDKLQAWANPFQTEFAYTVILAGTGRIWLQNKPILTLRKPTQLASQPITESCTTLQKPSPSAEITTDDLVESPPLPFENESNYSSQEENNLTDNLTSEPSEDKENDLELNLDLENSEEFTEPTQKEIHNLENDE